MNLKILHLTVYAINEKAKILYEKIGFKSYGSLPKAIEYKGKFIDHDLMYMEI